MVSDTKQTHLKYEYIILMKTTLSKVQRHGITKHVVVIKTLFIIKNLNKLVWPPLVTHMNNNWIPRCLLLGTRTALACLLWCIMRWYWMRVRRKLARCFAIKSLLCHTLAGIYINYTDLEDGFHSFWFISRWSKSISSSKTWSPFTTFTHTLNSVRHYTFWVHAYIKSTETEHSALYIITL